LSSKKHQKRKERDDGNADDNRAVLLPKDYFAISIRVKLCARVWIVTVPLKSTPEPEISSTHRNRDDPDEKIEWGNSKRALQQIREIPKARATNDGNHGRCGHDDKEKSGLQQGLIIGYRIIGIVGIPPSLGKVSQKVTRRKVHHRGGFPDV
jgi:hypothetical protein